MKKAIIPIILVLATVFAYYIFSNKTSGDYKEQLSKLDSSNKALEKTRDSLYKNIKSVDSNLLVLKKHDSLLNKEILELDAEVIKDKKIAAKSQAELNHIKNDLDSTRKQIIEAKAHPANRSGNDLLNSLKIKSKK
jgi:predicted RND superfamily exporter protein